MDSDASDSLSPAIRPMRSAKQGAISSMSALANSGYFVQQGTHHPTPADVYSQMQNKRNQITESEDYNVQVSGIAAFSIQDDTQEDESLSEISDFDRTFNPGILGRNQRKRPFDLSSDTSTRKRLAGRGRGRGRGSSRILANVTDREIMDDDSSLFAVVRNGKISLKQTVDDWVDDYCRMKEKEPALLSLMQFFIRSSGCKGVITAEMQETMDIPEIIRHMTEQFDEDSGDYPLVTPGSNFKRFRTNFADFIQHLVEACKQSVIYDQFLMDNVISLLTGLTDSQVRAFRHTATFAAMKLMTALVNVSLELSSKAAKNLRQLETERARHQSRQANDRLEFLLNTKQELEENQEEIRNMLQYIFKSVFVHRYRDVLPEIRSICIVELGVWMKGYPTMFLDDSYLKYIGWTLYDKVAEVRMKCLEALLPLYESEELASRMELFTNKFKDRLVSMVLDREFDVGVKAVKVATAIALRYPNLLNERDSESIYELVYSSHRGLAVAAGDFVCKSLFLLPAEEDTAAKKAKKRYDYRPLIADLVTFYIESELHEHGAYLVDSLLDIHDMMKDWESMTSLLLDDSGQYGPLDNRRERDLIELMVCAIKQAATGESPSGRGQGRKLSSGKEQKPIKDERVRITEHFIGKLPLLLKKFVADQDKIENLLQIPQYFELDLYTTSRQEKNMEALLKVVDEIVDKHHSEQVLLACSKVYEGLTDLSLSCHTRANLAKQKLIDGIVISFKQEVKYMSENAKDDEFPELLSALRKLEAFYQCHDMSHWADLYDTLFRLVQIEEEHSVAPVFVVKALKCCMLACMWELKAIEESAANPDQDRIRRLVARTENLCRICRDFFLTESQEVAETAFFLHGDLLLTFSWQLCERHPNLEPLILKIDVTTEVQMSRFVDEHVFVEEVEQEEIDNQEEIAVLHKRRGMLASFCKLIIYNVASIKAASAVFKHYARYYNDFGDIIKQTLAKCREVNKIQVAASLALALTDQYKLTIEEADAGNHFSVERFQEGLTALRELAKKFALSFGPDPMKNRRSVVKLHEEGISFACAYPEGVTKKQMQEAPPNLTFLEILMEFSGKLYRPDKTAVLQCLDKALAPGNANRGDAWKSLALYRNTLLDVSQEQTTVQNVSTSTVAGTSLKRRVRGQASRTSDTSTHEFLPAATSTVAKRPKMQEPMSDEESNTTHSLF